MEEKIAHDPISITLTLAKRKETDEDDSMFELQRNVYKFVVCGGLRFYDTKLECPKDLMMRDDLVGILRNRITH